MLEFLLARGADANARDRPVHRVVRGDRDTVPKLRALLDAGADARGAALGDAARYQRGAVAVEAATLLLDAGADVDGWCGGGERSRCNALTWAVIRKNVPLVELLLQRGARTDIRIESDLSEVKRVKPGMTPLRIAQVTKATDVETALRHVTHDDSGVFALHRALGVARVTEAVLVAGRRCGLAMSARQLAALLERVHEWAVKLQKPLVCAPGGDLGALQDPDERILMPVAIGLVVARADADDDGPTPVELPRLRGALAAAEDMPDELWADLQACVVEETGEPRLSEQPLGLWLAGAGPLPMAELAWGVSSRKVKQKGLVWLAGQDSNQKRHKTGVLELRRKPPGRRRRRERRRTPATRRRHLVARWRGGLLPHGLVRLTQDATV